MLHQLHTLACFGRGESQEYGVLGLAFSSISVTKPCHGVLSLVNMALVIHGSPKPVE